MLCGGDTSTDKSPTEKCELLHENKSERKILDELAPLLNKNFSVMKKENEESYTYVFQFCGDADGVPGAGVVQINDKTKAKTIVGRYNSTKAIKGSDWVMLIYENGAKYNSHCNGANRKAIVMISCDRSTDTDGCDFVCRSKNREEPNAYRGVGSEPADEEPEERDDHLLPM
uniref:MRH domain-containing protein n=1 Tax=Periophthalmus magnuspinnatus TaxID=409849 RepID=A0A3B4A810_9GOBI